MKKTDVVIIGASASGLMCAIEAASRGREVTVLDHANKAGKKILMSGGGRCNFTNYNVGSENYISHNTHFVKSAIKRFNQWDFIAMVEEAGIPYHEREHGQLFCNNSAKDILNLLLDKCKALPVSIKLKTDILAIEKQAHHFMVNTSAGSWASESLVIATGGLSIPKMGATPLGYKIAEQFGIHVWPTRAGLVPFTLHKADREKLGDLSGIAIEVEVRCKRQSFRENMLFTHRGLSGPAMLQISSYWEPGDSLHINLLPDTDLQQHINRARQQHKKSKLKNLLYPLLPKRVINTFIATELLDRPLQEISQKQQQVVIETLQYWQIKPNGTEGYRTAEVTLGGVDCDAISSKTFESKDVAGLYFIGEVLDISGWLGGYNFQWAWSSGWCAGQYA